MLKKTIATPFGTQNIERPFTTEEAAIWNDMAQARISFVGRMNTLKPVRDFWDIRKAAYEAELGTREQQLDKILEDGSSVNTSAVYNRIRTQDHPWTQELLDLKNSATDEELEELSKWTF